MPRPSTETKTIAVMKATIIQTRLRCRARAWPPTFGTSLLPKHWVIHAIPEVPPNEAAAADTPIKIIPTGLNIPATV